MRSKFSYSIISAKKECYMLGDNCLYEVCNELNRCSTESVASLKLLIATSEYAIIVSINSWASLSHARETKQ